MKLENRVCKYELSKILKPMMIFYGIYFFIIITIKILGCFLKGVSGTTSGTDSSTIAFVGIIALTILKPAFKFSQGNNISRNKFIEGTIKNSTNIDVKESEGFLIDTYGFQNFKYGWKFNSLAKKTSLLVETKCKNIFLLYKKTINEKAVDNEKEIILDTFFENGWGDYSATEILVKSKESFTHEIKIELIDFNEESIVNILGFLVS